MGKKPVLALSSLLAATLALTGCNIFGPRYPEKNNKSVFKSWDDRGKTNKQNSQNLPFPNGSMDPLKPGSTNNGFPPKSQPFTGSGLNRASSFQSSRTGINSRNTVPGHTMSGVQQVGHQSINPHFPNNANQNIPTISTQGINPPPNPFQQTNATPFANNNAFQLPPPQGPPIASTNSSFVPTPAPVRTNYQPARTYPQTNLNSIPAAPVGSSSRPQPVSQIYQQ